MQKIKKMAVYAQLGVVLSLGGGVLQFWEWEEVSFFTSGSPSPYEELKWYVRVFENSTYGLRYGRIPKLGGKMLPPENF